MTTRNEASASGAMGHPQSMKSAANGKADWLEQAVKTRELALRRAGLTAADDTRASAAPLAGASLDSLDSAYLVECQKLFELTRSMLTAER
jgi:hypothetical protein